MKTLRIIFLLYFTASCQEPKPCDFQETKLVYLIDNSDSNKFGYKNWDNDEDEGVKSITIDGQNLYLSDTFHNNIKKISLESNELTSSKNLSIDKLWLRDIVVFNDKLVVTCDVGKLIILDLNLNLINTIDQPRSRSFVYNISKEKLMFYISHFQNEKNKNINVVVNVLDSEFKSKLDTLSVSSSRFLEKIKANNKSTSNNFDLKNKDLVIEDINCFLNLEKYNIETNYDSYDLLVDKKSVSYFNAYKDSLVVKYYLLK